MNTIFFHVQAVLPAATSPNGRGSEPRRARFAQATCRSVTATVARMAFAYNSRPGHKSPRVSVSCAPSVGAHAQGRPDSPDCGAALPIFKDSMP